MNEQETPIGEKVNIFRTIKTENPFAQIDKRLINDKTISWKTKGILIYLLSKPNDWIAKIDDIIGHATEGRDAVRTAIQEAIKAGYILKKQSHDENGKFTNVEYQVFEQPTKSTADGFSAYGKTVDGKTAYGKSDTTNNEYTNNKKETNKESIYTKNGNSKFIKPTIEQISDYCKERKNNIDAEYFFDYYETRGWILTNKQKMKDWQAAVRTWERNNFNRQEDEIPDDFYKYIN